MTTQNKVEPKEAIEEKLKYAKMFLEIAQKLREFERYETLKNLTDRYRYCIAPHIYKGTDAYNRRVRITFIGNSSISEKRDLIKSAFPNSDPIPIEHSPEFTSDIEYYNYRTAKGVRFTFINTPELNKWIDVNRSADRKEWDTEVIVFIISGTKIDKTEKEYLKRIKLLFDSNALFFIQALETLPTSLKDENLRIISNILSVKEENIHYFSSTDNRSATQCLATEIEKKPQQYWLELMVQKMRNYIVRSYKLFETKVDHYLKQRSKYKDFCEKLQGIQEETTKKVNRFGENFKKTLNAAFPVESSYSNVIRPQLKELGEKLAKKKVKEEVIEKELEALRKHCYEKWSEKLEVIITEYFWSVSHVLNTAINNLENSYNRSYSLLPVSLLPVNREIQVQTMSEFSKDFFKSSGGSWLAGIAKSSSTSFFPAYLTVQGIAAAKAAVTGGTAGTIATAITAFPPVAVIAGIALVVIGITLIVTLANRYEKRMASQARAYAEIEKDSKPFNHDIALAIREQFGEIVHFSEIALKNIFEEIRKTKQKQVTINSAYPEISVIDNSLLTEIRKNRESIEKGVKESKNPEDN